jgi:Undecaprenyl-phosphate glucose phosphotransferase
MNAQPGFENDGLTMPEIARRTSAPRVWKGPPSMDAPGVAASPHDHRNHTILPWIVRLLDGGTVIGATVLTAWIGSHLVNPEQINTVMIASLISALVFFLTLQNARAPALPFLNIILQQVRFLVPPMVIAALIQAAVLWWLGWMEWPLLRASFTWIALAAGGLLITRTLSNVVLRKPAMEQRLTRKMAIIGYDIHAFRIAEIFAADSQQGMSVAGVFSDHAKLSGTAQIDGSIAALISLSQETELDGIIIALPPSPANQKQIAQLSWELRSVLSNIFVMPYMIQDPEILLRVQPIGSVVVLLLHRRPLDEWQTILKKMVDLAIGLPAFLILMPLFISVAIAIKIDSDGPVFFRQSRAGFNNHQFMVYKFRSMHEGKTDIHAVRQTSRSDPRVTRVGKWLRRLSIDETPQLLNVLRGEMSLVGPRPHAMQTRVEGELLNDVLSDYIVRFRVKPGITGWAQVNGARGELVTTDDLRRRVAYDLDYIQHWSAWFDIKIMALTVAREIVSNHAF